MEYPCILVKILSPIFGRHAIFACGCASRPSDSIHEVQALPALQKDRLLEWTWVPQGLW